MYKHIQSFILITMMLFLGACTGSGGDSETPTPTGPTAGSARIIAIQGGTFSKVANNSALVIETAVIKNELDEVIPDGYVFEILADEAGTTFSKFDEDNYASKIEVASVGGKVKFKSKYSTSVGLYRVRVKDKASIVTGRFSITILPGEVASLGEIKTTRYEDLPPYNGVKDGEEHWSLLADGFSTTYLSAGPITDAFGNLVDNTNIRLSMSDGDIISENPVGASDGIAYFRIESTNIPKFVTVSVEALDNLGNPLVFVNSEIQFVRGNLQIQDSGILGNVYLNNDIEKTFVVRNGGTREVTNITYGIDSPFVIKAGSTCLGKNKLRVQEECNITVKFSSAIRGLYQGNLRVIGSPVNVAGSSLIFPLQANAVLPADLRVSRGEIDFGEQKCGNMYQEELYVENVGDEDALNVVLQNPPPYPGFQTSYFQMIAPALDNPMNPDPTVPVNCGNTFFHGRKCRIVVRFNPQALVLSTALQGHITATGGFDIPLTVRGQSKLGDPFGTIPVVLTTEEERIANSQFASDNVLLNTPTTQDKYADVRVGPIKDKCNNTINVANVELSVTKGTLADAVVVTNSGIGLTTWKSSFDIADLGTQTVSAVIHDSLNAVIATGSKVATFRGVNLQLTGTTNLGQILTKKSRVEFYTLKNTGNINAQNVATELNPSGQTWFVLDNNYVGGCQDGILEAGAECLIKVTFNTDLNFSPSTNNVGNISTTIKMSSLERGVNSSQVSVTGRSEQPPVLSFSPNPYDFGNPAVIAGTPALGLITLSNAGPATAFNLTYTIDNPFTIDASRTTCGTSLLGSQNCVVGIKMSQTTKGPYAGSLKVGAEFNNAQTGFAAIANISTQIAANLAGGTIPISFGSNSISLIIPTTDTISTSAAHGLSNAQLVSFSGSTAPGGITFGNTYYVSVSSATQFKVYTNSSLTTLVDITSAGSGVTFEKLSVPADKTSKITMTIGPIRDAYNNVVNTGTQVKVSANAGKLGGDADNDGIILLTTNSSGNVTADIVSAEFSEIRTFTITAEVLNGPTVIASGTKSGAFTGAKLEFVGETYDFSLTTAGSAKVQNLTLRNNGNESITGLAVVSSDSTVYPISHNCSSLAPNATCTITVVFQPPEALTYNATISASGSGRGVTADTFSLTGQGVLAAKLVITNPANKNLAVALIPGVSAAGSFVVTNTGNEVINSYSVSSNLRNSEFIFVPQGSCSSLGFNQTCSTSFTFNPTSAISGNVNVILTAHGESATRTTDDFLSLSFVPAVIQITRPEDQLASDCGIVKIGLRDGNNAAVVAPQNLTYSLSKTGPTGAFYSNNTCSSVISSIGIAQGASDSANFYYKGNSGTHEITVSSGSAYSYSANILIYNALTATANPATVTPGLTSQITPLGGSSPYTYQVNGGAGNGSVNSSGLYTAPGTPGSYSVKVRDSRVAGSLSYDVTINVVATTISCTGSITNSATATQTYNVGAQSYGTCTLGTCSGGYTAYNNACYETTASCTGSIANSAVATQTFNSGTGTYGACSLVSCAGGYRVHDTIANTCFATKVFFMGGTGSAYYLDTATNAINLAVNGFSAFGGVMMTTEKSTEAGVYFAAFNSGSTQSLYRMNATTLDVVEVSTDINETAYPGRASGMQSITPEKAVYGTISSKHIYFPGQDFNTPNSTATTGGLGRELYGFRLTGSLPVLPSPCTASNCISNALDLDLFTSSTGNASFPGGVHRYGNNSLANNSDFAVVSDSVIYAFNSTNTSSVSNTGREISAVALEGCCGGANVLYTIDTMPGTNSGLSSSVAASPVVSGTNLYYFADGLNTTTSLGIYRIANANNPGAVTATANISLIRAVSGTSPALMTMWNNRLFFRDTLATGETELFYVDLSNNSINKIELVTGTGSSANGANSILSMAVYNNKLYLSANLDNRGTSYGQELYQVTDNGGGSFTTVLVSDIRSGVSGSAPTYLVENGARLFFVAHDGTNYKLMSYNGSAITDHSAAASIFPVNPSFGGKKLLVK